jgi:hypothetical protein
VRQLLRVYHLPAPAVIIGPAEIIDMVWDSEILPDPCDERIHSERLDLDMGKLGKPPLPDGRA